MGKRSFVLAGMLLSGIIYLANAQTVLPEPQKMHRYNGKLSYNSFMVSDIDVLDKWNQEFLMEILPINKEKSWRKGPKILFQKIQHGDSLSKISAAYKLSIKKNQVVIAYNNQTGIYYALQTLKQLKQKVGKKEQLPTVDIIDYPDVAHRGTVEGFYGTPWSFEDRINQLSFYGALKMNTYIYGPKDDPYHSSPHWRDAYPSDKAREIETLVNHAAKNRVNFVWAIHPGKDIRWNKEDSLNLLNKFEKMYALGVRAFAVFFDDIAGEGTSPAKQAGVLNFLQKNFVEQKHDVQPLIMCPTEYNKGWANPKPGSYLDILGEQLLPEIQIMWTGNTVVSDIDMPTMEWINKRIRRKAFIWWNFPVSDYVRNHLLMGPAYGNTTDIANAVSGFVSNPMERAEASKIGIFGVAMYCWNMKNYKDSIAFLQGINYIMPEAKEALKIFAENNSDLGPNNHGYRRKESEYIAPYIQAYRATMYTDKTDKNNQQIVENYFSQIEKAPEIIISKAQNKNLVREIKPWLQQFQWLGKWGTGALEMNRNFNDQTIAKNWHAILELQHAQKQISNINDTANQNPYQPGIKTGSLVLTPFVEELAVLLENKLLFPPPYTKQLTAVVNEKVLQPANWSQQLMVNTNDNMVMIKPLLEVLTLQPGDYIGLSWLDNRLATELLYHFNVKDFAQWGSFEYSKDGEHWEKVPFNLGKNRRSIAFDGNKYRQIRFKNISDSAQQIYLKEFKVKTKPSAVSSNLRLMMDNSLRTCVQIAPNESIQIETGTTKQIRLFVQSNDQLFSIVMNHQKLYSGKDNFCSIPTPNSKKANVFIIENNGGQPIKIYEFIKQ